ncbi:MAG: 6,7-dimethyl-8-ribityllumazine synthase [Muribaculaceae bacterium]|nr:6,7-dimethyl-8-ribityllumazine synthase [Muribaculaceae bacterium]
MSTELHNSISIELPHVEGLKVGIVVARWNSQVTEPLLNGAIDRIEEAGYSRDDITVQRVPGTVELTFAAAQMARSGKFDTVIMIGCVIRGGTPHFDYVCDNATQGCAMLNATQNVPIIFCVLTTDDEQQALDRAGGALCNKGTEAAEAAIEMAAIARNYNNIDF